MDDSYELTVARAISTLPLSPCPRPPSLLRHRKAPSSSRSLFGSSASAVQCASDARIHALVHVRDEDDYAIVDHVDPEQQFNKQSSPQRSISNLLHSSPSHDHALDFHDESPFDIRRVVTEDCASTPPTPVTPVTPVTPLTPLTSQGASSNHPTIVFDKAELRARGLRGLWHVPAPKMKIVLLVVGTRYRTNWPNSNCSPPPQSHNCTTAQHPRLSNVSTPHGTDDSIVCCGWCERQLVTAQGGRGAVCVAGPAPAP